MGNAQQDIPKARKSSWEKQGDLLLHVPGMHLLALQAMLPPHKEKKERATSKQELAAAVHFFSVCKQYLWCIGVKLTKMA